MDHAFYSKQFNKATVFSEEDFAHDMTKGSIVGLIVGFGLAVFGTFGVVHEAEEAGKLLFSGLAVMACSVAYQCFPRFRKFFDGGSHGDIFDRELDSLIDQWESSGVATRSALSERENIAFYGKPNGMTLYAIVRIKDDDLAPDAGDSSTYVFAHYTVFRKHKNKKDKGRLWEPLSARFEGTDADLMAYLEDLNGNVIETLKEMSKTHNFKTMPDPLDLPPLDQLKCVPQSQ